MSFSLFNLQTQNPVMETVSELSNEVKFNTPIPHKINEIEISCPSFFDTSIRPGYPNPVYMSYAKDKFVFEQYKDTQKIWETEINLNSFPSLDNTMFMSMSGLWAFRNSYELPIEEKFEYVTFYNSVIIDLKNQKVYRKKYIYEYEFTGNEQNVNGGIGTPGTYRIPGQLSTSNAPSIEIAPQSYYFSPTNEDIQLFKNSHFTISNGSYYPGSFGYPAVEFWGPMSAHFYNGTTSYSYNDFCTFASNEKAKGTPVKNYYIRNTQNFGNYHETYPVQQWSSDYLENFSSTYGCGPRIDENGNIVFDGNIHHAKDKYPEIIDITNTSFGNYLLTQFANIQQYTGDIVFKSKPTTVTSGQVVYPVISVKYFDTPHKERI